MPDKDVGEMKYHKGKIVAIGPVVESAKVGDTIFYDNHRAYDTVIEGNKVTVIREIDGIVVLD
jgi:co-chaperonin GroES (HSP10)